MRIGVDLLWVRVGICGGTESYIRNLLDGFARYDKENEYILFVAEDNGETFEHYEKNTHMHLCRCGVKCRRQPIRILWENLFLDRAAKKQKLDVMFIPVYSMPKKYGSRIPYLCTIHDLQAIHYPQYFSKLKKVFLEYTWRKACKTAERIIVTSDYTKRDLKEHYPQAKDKVCTIPIAVLAGGAVKAGQASPAEDFPEKKYQVSANGYFYCVSSMLPHKNLETLLKLMKLRKSQGERMPLVLSGVGGKEAEFDQLTAKLDIGDVVVNTGFVTDAERDCLYKNCRLFLFPSVFEGFGMPPIEAMRWGKQVVMTGESCLEEVTEGKAVYVTAPYDAEEWNRKLEEALQKPSEVQGFERYELENVVKEYLKVFEEVSRN